MNLRSITCFLDPGWPLDESLLEQAGHFIAHARPAFEDAGYPVQTTRLATVPFPNLLPPGNGVQALELARALEEAAAFLGFDYVSLGPALPDRLDSYAWIPEILSATQNVFLAGVLASPRAGLSLSAAQACARVIRQVSGLDPHGFGNLYFAALANVPPGSPFFPAAYHGGGPPAFALATEAADLAVEALEERASLAEARRALIGAVERHGRRLAEEAGRIAEKSGLSFAGIDFTLAPYPEASRSIGTALEHLGAPALGLPGSLAATAILTATLEQANYPRAGFNGLMLPVLEDAILAERAAAGLISVTDLLLYSTVCGTGLDTVPLPGDTSLEALTAILVDLAALALRLDKPLTARLMPIPGKIAGETTEFDFPYFANSRVLALPARPLEGWLAGEDSIPLAPQEKRSSRPADAAAADADLRART